MLDEKGNVENLRGNYKYLVEGALISQQRVATRIFLKIKP